MTLKYNKITPIKALLLFSILFLSYVNAQTDYIDVETMRASNRK